ncbi:MAG: NAD(P)H-hydrate dehydratase [Gammaproteobacteria bacterium]|nr:NAD(P)H-hydrate dehydratase [Gammaproteobacteria bacterium]NNJ91802.1 NAD(P)H-hydrate dehydratase [Gammaproteobacteria bacterium]
MPTKEQLPYALYRAEQVRKFDALAINKYQIPGQTLMGRAGKAAFDLLRNTWPEAKRLVVVTGSGNNAGDGYCVALLALQAGLDVRVLELAEHEQLTADAAYYATEFINAAGQCSEYENLPLDCDVIVDAILGTGLNTDVRGAWASVIHAINHHKASVLALDIPSGLHADSGTVLGTAVKADHSISFIGLKQGMFTGRARDYCGEIHFHALDIPARIYASEILACRRIDWQKLKQRLVSRPRSAHKGDFGRVLVVAGNKGFAGAARLCAEAALRSGAGLVSVATHAFHAATLNTGRPELMVHAVEAPSDIKSLLNQATAIVIGPGLGQDPWALQLLEAVLQSGKRAVIDADALNLLASGAVALPAGTEYVLTPHPGEAGRLLQTDVTAIESDRFAAVSKLSQQLRVSVVLKGAGTLVASQSGKPMAACSQGNPGMASGGMGDVLAGLLGTFLAQNEDIDDAVCLGVCLHAAAADVAAQQGETGLLASDLFEHLRGLLNDIG